MAEADGVIDGGPAVGVDWDGIADGDACVEDAHPFIFEDQRVVVRRGDDGVEFGRPGPRFFHDLEQLRELVHGESRFAD